MAGKKPKSVDLGYLNDDRLSKGKQEEAAAKLKGPSHKERQELQKESKRAVQQRLTREKEKTSWKKRAAAIAALFMLCGAGLYQFVSTVAGFLQGDGIATLAASETARLKQVLFSGDPWLVYCVNEETASRRLPRVLEDSARGIHRNLGVRTAVLPCWDKTESGRSVAERFKLAKAPPVSFVVANGNKPKVINLVGVSTQEALEKLLKPALHIETYRIDALKKWPSLCTSRRTCVVVGHKNTAQRDNALNVFRPLLERHRGTKVVTLDTSFWQLKLDEAVLATRSSQSRGKAAEVLCLARDESGGNATFSGGFLQDVSVSAADAFLKACEVREGLVRLEKAPKINARPTKPKKVSAPSPPAPRPRAPPAAKEATRGKVDRVGSRERMESEEPLFEAVEEEEEDEREGGERTETGAVEEEEDEEGDGGDEVEL